MDGHSWTLCCINNIKLDLLFLMGNSSIGDKDIFHFYLGYAEAKTILVGS